MAVENDDDIGLLNNVILAMVGYRSPLMGEYSSHVGGITETSGVVVMAFSVGGKQASQGCQVGGP